MALDNDSKDTSQTAPTATDFAQAIVDQIVSLPNIDRLMKSGENSLVVVAKILIGVVLGVAGRTGAFLADLIVSGEDIADPAFQRLMQVAFKDITGVDLGAAPAGPGQRAARAAGAKSLGAALMAAIAGGAEGGAQGGAVVPSQVPAENYVTWVPQMALEG